MYCIRIEGIPEGAAGGGRGLCLRLNNTCKQFNVAVNRILSTLFPLRNKESTIIAVMPSNIHDLLYGHLLEGAETMNSVLQQFFTVLSDFCGEEFQQDEDCGIHVTMKDNTERVKSSLDDAKHDLSRKASAHEVHPLRSVTQPLAWIVRQTRLDFSHRISKTQSTFESSCDRIVEFAISTSTHGIYFSPAFSWDDTVVVRISDASFCVEQEQVDGITQNFKSQQACVIASGDW